MERLPRAIEIETAHAEGYEAACEGLSVCPHSDPVLSEAWQEGHAQGMADMDEGDGLANRMHEAS